MRSVNYIMKKVSLLLTTYNCKENLKRTLKSIESQDYALIEVCVADGGSTDGTIAEIENYQNTSKYEVKFSSEKDKGIYDGLNHSIAMSTGDYLQVMNDIFTREDSVTLLVEAIENGGRECVGAHADLIYKDQNKVKRYWRMGLGQVILGWMPAHPTLMLKKEIYETYGMYNITFKCSADYEFMLRFLKHKVKLAYVPQVLITMFYGGTSTQSAGSYMISVKESILALKYNGYHLPVMICFFRTIRVVFQFIKANFYKEVK